MNFLKTAFLLLFCTIGSTIIFLCIAWFVSATIRLLKKAYSFCTDYLFAKISGSDED